MVLLKRYSGLFALLCLLTGCIQFDTADLDNLNGDVKVIGHAGSGFARWYPFNPYPSNSLASIRKALEAGAEGIELDLHMTADHDFVLYHDNFLDSRTNVSACPSELELSEMTKLQYRLGFPFDQFQNEYLLSLDSLIDFLQSREETKMEIHLDIRSFSECENAMEQEAWEKILIRRLDETIKASTYPADKFNLISYSKDLLAEAVKLKLPYQLCFEIDTEIEERTDWAKSMGIDCVIIKPKLLSKDLSKRIHERGMQLITFGAKSKSGNKNLLQMNPDVIQTDNVTALRKLLSK